MRMRDWVVCDPYVCDGGTNYVKSFDSKENAEIWLAKMQEQDDDGYCGCEIMSIDEYKVCYG